MTQAQKTAKAKFKQAIAYRTKTGVSLKEAFAHIYGKKKVVKKAVKKAAPKKKVLKKVGNVTLKKSNRYKGDDRYSIMNDSKPHLDGKVFSKSTATTIANALRKVKAKRKKVSGVKDSAKVKKELAKKGLKMPHGYLTIKRKRKISGVKSKKITEQGILNRIHKVKKGVEQLDEAQHKHMIGAVNKLSLRKYEETLNTINKVQYHIAEYTKMSKDMNYNLDNRKSFKLSASKWKKYLTELKAHAKELKKLI